MKDWTRHSNRTTAWLLGSAMIAFCASAQAQSLKYGGVLQAEVKRIIDEPDRWSTMRLRGDGFVSGGFGDDNKFKLALRADTDYASRMKKDYYPRRLDQEQRFNLDVREAWVDLPHDDFSLRIGRQYINWGEAIGVFVADVVNARDLREFVAADLDQLRIGQWALRGEWTGDDKQAELLWIPYPSYDNISVPGSDYYPVLPSIPGLTTVIQDDPERPSHRLSNSNWGVRGGFLKNGWDVSGFYYNSLDRQVAFARTIGVSTLTYTPRVGTRIWQSGATATKDLDFAVLKLEGVYSHGHEFSVNRASDDDGLVQQNTFDWLAGLDVPVGDDTKINLQVFQRIILNRDSDLFDRQHQNLASIQLTQPYGKFEFVALLVHDLNRSDYMFRPKVTYRITKDTHLIFGADIFKGQPTGLFGQYDNKDRVYLTLRNHF
ncbi:MAG: hypothetical protein EPO06_08785 [Burkholderiaceae bacterium]|nr:MAG: hypothetical protein EPO06_08785 [Burkholderiaceae bacterium]